MSTLVMPVRTKDALETILDFATRYIENQQEGLPFNVTGDWTDEQIKTELDKKNVGDDPLYHDYDFDNAIDVRNFDRAAATITALLAQRGCDEFGIGGEDDLLTTMCDVVVFG